MEYSIFFRIYLLPVRLVFLCFPVFFLSPKFPQAGTRGEENFQSRMGAIGMRKPDA